MTDVRATPLRELVESHREEIKAIWNFGNQKRLDQLFINRGKYPPGNKEFLYTIARYLQQSS